MKTGTSQGHPLSPNPKQALTRVWFWLEPVVVVANSEYLFPVTKPAHLRYSSRTWGPRGGQGQSCGLPLPGTARTHLLIEHAVQQEEEQALQAVEDGEGVRQEPVVWVKEEQAEDPRAAQHDELRHGRDGQHPVGKWVR